MENINSAEKLDARWYARFVAVHFDDYEKLNGNKDTREDTQNKFLSGEIDNPTLDYPELASFDLDEREQALLELKEDILELEQNNAVKKLYRTKINESLATLRMLRATKTGDDRKFSRYADFIYGKPDTNDVGYIVQHVQDVVTKNLESENPEKQQAALRLHELFSPLSFTVGEGADKSILPAGQTIPGKLESAEEAMGLIEASLQEIDTTNWEVLIDTEDGISNFSVSQEHKVIRVPSTEKLLARNISKKKIQGIIAEEIKTHVARRENGERSRLLLLGLGLDRSLGAEEGIGAYHAQQVTGAKEFAGVPRFLSIALAKGLSGKTLDFRQTHTIMTDYRLLTSPKKDVTLEHAALIAYNDCTRIFRGSSCNTPGAVYPKDMAYFSNRAIWTLVSKNSDVVKTFTIGKYDPNNSEHIALLIQLGILDSDLAELETEQ